MNHKQPSFFLALFPILVLIFLLVLNVQVFGDDAIGGANQIALLFSAMVGTFVALYLGIGWKQLEKGIVHSIGTAISAIVILLLIGALAGTWMISGIVPTMIYYGLDLIHPSVFLVTACIVSAIVSLATGSSWTTVATVGVALIGIGTAQGIHEGMVAGAIISGAYFGDKMSPLSDTTNLAPAMAGTDLITHIKYMTITTFPSIIITLMIFLIIGLNTDIQEVSKGVGSMLKALDNKFYISPILFITPAIVVIMIIKKVKAIPALFIGILLGGITAIIFQPDVILEIAGNMKDYAKASYITVIDAITVSTNIQTGNEEVNALISTRGMQGMLNTIWLILCAMIFGGVLEAAGLLQKITHTLVKFASDTGSLVATTATTCIFFNATTSDQYLAIVVPGKMYEDIYPERGLKPENLSRTLEDSGTVTSVLFPWNTCGATQSTVLGVATGQYWMYCFFNLLSPIMTVLFAYLNIKIARLSKKEQEAITSESQTGV